MEMSWGLIKKRGGFINIISYVLLLRFDLIHIDIALLRSNPG